MRGGSQGQFGFVTLLVNNAGTADIELFTDMTDEKLCEMMNESAWRNAYEQGGAS
ncbi:MAG: hypothetical protein ACLTCP_04920 [Ruminococcus bicirculans (ex Wegman et al. 2014)]